MGHEVTLVEQRRDRFEQLEVEFGHVAMLGDATEINCSSGPGSPVRRISCSRSRVTTRTT